MTVKNELLNLSEYWRGRLLRISRKLLRRHINIHTIILGRTAKQGACEFLNFQFFVFFDEERDMVSGEKRAPSVHFGEEVLVSEKYSVYEPGMGYKNITGTECVGECVSECEYVCECVGERECVDGCECKALHYEYGNLTPKLRQAYLDYLNTHCQHFVCKDFPEIVTLNMMEMKRDSAQFFRYYFTGKFDQGYWVYNREMKPLISLE